MSTTTESPRAVLVRAHRVAAAALPAYSRENSPKKFTQHQLFACSALKAAMALDHRGVAALLVDSPDLAAAVGLRRVPHWTAPRKASTRLLAAPAAAALLDATVAPPRARPRRKVGTAAVDSTGLESRRASRYCVRRKSRGSDAYHETTYGRFPKLALACDCASHPILSAVAGGGLRSATSWQAPATTRRPTMPAPASSWGSRATRRRPAAGPARGRRPGGTGV